MTQDYRKRMRRADEVARDAFERSEAGTYGLFLASSEHDWQREQLPALVAAAGDEDWFGPDTSGVYVDPLRGYVFRGYWDRSNMSGVAVLRERDRGRGPNRWKDRPDS